MREASSIRHEPTSSHSEKGISEERLQAPVKWEISEFARIIGWERASFSPNIINMVIRPASLILYVYGEIWLWGGIQDETIIH
jgi:hypothetical protein